MDLDTVGVDGPRLFAVTPAEAKRALDRFIEHRLPAFGRYEDAIMGEDWAMSHSLLSVPLNLGVLHPLDAVEAAEQAYRENGAPLAAVEGFIRQILGWREYMWHLYWHFGPKYTRNNELGAAHAAARLVDGPRRRRRHRRMPAPRPEGVRDRGWTHHIQRLMVLGNHALQRGYQPDAADRVVRDGVRRRLSLGDADQRRRHEPARRRRPARHQAVRVRRRLHQQDERPLRRLRLRPEEAPRRRRLPVHRRLLDLRAPQPGPARQEQPDATRASPRWTGSRTSTPCSSRKPSEDRF